MAGSAVVIGPWAGGLNNAAGNGENIGDDELFSLTNLEVDIDNSLVNRPAVREFVTSGFTGSKDGIKIIGTYQPDNLGNDYLVVTTSNRVSLVNASTGSVAGTQVVTGGSVACVQHNDRVYIIPRLAGNGGYFSSALTWTAAAALPRGESATLFRDRLFVASGATSTTNKSRLYFSDINDGTSWPGPNNIDIYPGNGQKLTAICSNGTDILLFKEHSTYKLTYGADIAKGSVDLVDAKVGAANQDCISQYQSNTVYVIHSTNIYELFDNRYTRISANLDMDQSLDADVYTTELVGVTVFKERLFVRYYSNVYVLRLDQQKWSKWVTTRKFNRIFSLYLPNSGIEVAYASTASIALTGRLFYIYDDTLEGVEVGESFDCSLTSKVYDFADPTKYKKIFWAGLGIATSGTTTITATFPNTGSGPTWDDLELGTWDDLELESWSEVSDISISTTAGSELGLFARKVIKCLGKARFRQVQFMVTTNAATNTRGNASVRIYELTCNMATAETIVRTTT